MTIKPQVEIIVVDALNQMILLSSLKTISLNFAHKCEIIRQVFSLMDSNFSDFNYKAKQFVNFKQLGIETIHQHCIEEINSVCYEVAISFYFELVRLKLFNNYMPERGFPFFVEHIDSNSVYLRLEPGISYFPY